MESNKIPFSEVSHIDCRTLGFATTLRGGYQRDEEREAIGLTKKLERELPAQTVDKIEKDMKCDKFQCKRNVIRLIEAEMDVSFPHLFLYFHLITYSYANID